MSFEKYEKINSRSLNMIEHEIISSDKINDLYQLIHTLINEFIISIGIIINICQR